ncbi:hypothetical protein QJS04_geneDACA014827 [Acorus gramineus]|uniref:Uncharacterized protein n=1 Tax=Acorus gramineus TaxID=55184 RepID=A0AAV9BPA2_ACOGR|nr:hypothetical protein QJS04_geneDACA014827 [Acorus gramineus]
MCRVKGRLQGVASSGGRRGGLASRGGHSSSRRMVVGGNVSRQGDVAGVLVERWSEGMSRFE